MNTIENDLIYRFKKFPHVQLTEFKDRVVNIKTGRELKIVFNSRSLGVWVGRKFITVSNFDKETELIKLAKDYSDLDVLLMGLRGVI